MRTKNRAKRKTLSPPAQQRPGRMRSILAWMRTKNIAKSKASSHPNACLSDSVPFHFKHPPRRAKHRAAGWVRSFLRRKTFCEGRKTAARIGVTNKFFSPPDSKQGGGRKRSTKIKFKFVRIEKNHKTWFPIKKIKSIMTIGMVCFLHI